MSEEWRCERCGVSYRLDDAPPENGDFSTSGARRCEMPATGAWPRCEVRYIERLGEKNCRLYLINGHTARPVMAAMKGRVPHNGSSRIKDRQS